MEVVRKVGWGQAMKVFTRGQQQFRISAQMDREPVKRRENWGDMVVFFGSSKEARN